MARFNDVCNDYYYRLHLDGFCSLYCSNTHSRLFDIHDDRLPLEGYEDRLSLMVAIYEAHTID